jgi:hypothetical protein
VTSSSATLELGRPADHARGLARAALLRAGTLSAVAGAIAALAAHLLAPDELAALRPALVAAVAAASLMFRAVGGPFYRARAGIRSEVRVARALRRCNAAAVVHGALLGARGGDADHIVLGSICALVETKTGRGRVTVTASGRVRAGGRWMPKAPVTQATRQAEKVSRATGLACTPIVCVVDMQGRPQHVGAAIVCSVSHLPEVLASLPAVVGPHGARSLAKRLHEVSQENADQSRTSAPSNERSHRVA